jgi:hypothetical protein
MPERGEIYTSEQLTMHVIQDFSPAPPGPSLRRFEMTWFLFVFIN